MTTSFEKILVCLDHSDADQWLVQNSCTLSKVAGTKHITFLNIIKDFNIPEQLIKEFPDLMDKALEDRKNGIQKLIDTHFKCEVEVDILVKQGGRTKEILKAANELDFNLIVLGKKDTSDSVLSTRVARRSPCSLMILPEKVELKLDKIFIPVDFSEYSSLSINRTLALTSNLSSEIYLQNVYTVPSSYRYSGKSYEEFSEIMKGHASNDLEVLIKNAEVKSQELIPVCTQDQNGKVIDLIMEEATHKEVNMIVMGAKGRTTASALFIGSMSERMIRINDQIPLLIIRKKGAVAGLLEALKDL